jgi:hypothetical protein
MLTGAKTAGGVTEAGLVKTEGSGERQATVLDVGDRA